MPCSGTTIICRYFHSIPDCFFISEPFGEFDARGYMDPFPEAHSVEELLESRPERITGFKECYGAFRAQHFETWREKPGWKKVAILRDPFLTWGSFCRKGTHDVDAFTRDYMTFLDKITQGWEILSYERFCQSPETEASRILGVTVPPGMTMKRLYPQRYGNPTAFTADRIEEGPLRPVAPEHQAVINASGAWGRWKLLIG